MRQNPQGRVQVEMEKGAVPEEVFASTGQVEAIRQLFINLLREGLVIRSLALGESMSPCIKKGDSLMVKPISLEEARIGDIVAYRRDESHSVLTNHRVIRIGKDRGQRYLITKGDPNVYCDFPLVSPEDVLGKVVSIERNGRVTSLETPFYRLLGYLKARLSLGLWILGVLKRKISLLRPLFPWAS